MSMNSKTLRHCMSGELAQEFGKAAGMPAMCGSKAYQYIDPVRVGDHATQRSAAARGEDLQWYSLGSEDNQPAKSCRLCHEQ